MEKKYHTPRICSKRKLKKRKTTEAKIIIIITYIYIIIVFIPNRARFNEKYMLSHIYICRNRETIGRIIKLNFLSMEQIVYSRKSFLATGDIIFLTQINYIVSI